MNGDPNSITIPQPIAPPNTDNQPATPAPAPQPSTDASMIATGAAKTAATATSPLTSIPAPNQPMPKLAPPAPGPSPFPGTAAENESRAPQTKGEWFNHILKAVTPQQNVIRTNPDGTQSVTDARTAPSMTKMFMASVMAGMMSPTKYREGAYGPVVDSSGTAAGAFQAGAEKGKELSGAAQKQYDDMQTRKLNAVAANTAAMHSYASMQMAQSAAEKEGAEAEALQTKNWNDIVDQNKSTILASADDFDNNREKGSPSARLTSGMTTEELLASPFKDKMTSQLMVQDGTRSVFDPKTGKQKTVPTWTVLNPDVDIKLNQAAVERAAKINPGFANLWQNTNGNVRLNLGRYAAITHQINSVDHAEDLLQGIANSDDKDLKALGIHGDVEGRLAKAAQGNSTAMKALMDFESATAHGGNTAQQLQRLLSADGGDKIFAALGTDRDKVTDYVNKVALQLEKKNAIAKAGGNPAKLPATDAQIQDLKSSVAPDGKYLTQEDSAALNADIPKPDEDGNVSMNQQEIAAITQKRDSIVAKAKDNEIKAGDPSALAAVARNTIVGDVNDIVKMQSYRTADGKNKAIEALHDLASAYGLDTTRYSQNAMENKAKVATDYTGNKKGSTGAQIASFNTLVGHVQEANDLTNKLAGKTIGLTRSPWLNTASDKLAKEVTNDPDWMAYTASLIPVKNEYANLLAAGYSPKEDDAASIRQILDPHETPARVQAALKQLATTADIRLANIGATYTSAMGRNAQRLLSTDAGNSLKRMGIDSKAAAFSNPLPRGWVETPGQNPTQTMVDPKSPQGLAIYNKFKAAAGGNSDDALEFMKENGYTYPGANSK